MKKHTILINPSIYLILLLYSATIMATNPVVNDDTFQAVEGIPLLLDVIANDYDEDGDPLIVSLVAPATTSCWGSNLNQLIINNDDGSLIFKTPNDISGSCSFNYRVQNGSQFVAATVTIHITKLSTLLPKINTQPVASQISLNDSATFLVDASSTAPLTYRWQKNGQDLTEGNGITGTDSAQLSIIQAGLNDLAQYRCVVTNDFGDVTTNQAGLLLITDQAAQASFHSNPFDVPSTIGAEFYDLGGMGTSHHDTTSDNQGMNFRTGGADIALASDNSFYVTHIEATEWLEFTFDIPATGNYDLTALVAEDSSTDVQFHWETSDGTQLTCEQAVTINSGAENWQEIQAPSVTLSAGIQTLRFVADSGGWNLDAIGINSASSTSTQSPFLGTAPDVLTGIIEIENYDRGGPNVAFFDQTEGNASNFCGRLPDWVDLNQRPTNEVVALDIDSGEWLEFTLAFPTTALYDLTLRYKAATATQVEMRIPGSPDTVINIPLTAQADFGPTTLTDLSLPQGTHVVRFTFIDATGKDLQINNFQFSPGRTFPIRVTDAANVPVNDGQVIPLNPIPVNTSLNLTYRLHNDHPSLPLSVDSNTISGQAWQKTLALPTSIPPQSSAEFKVHLSSSVAIPAANAAVTLSTSGASTEAMSFTLQGSVFLPLTDIGMRWSLPASPPDYHDVTGTNPVEIPIDVSADRLFFLVLNKGSESLKGTLSLTNTSDFMITNPSVDLAPSTSPDPATSPTEHFFEVAFIGNLQDHGPKSTGVKFDGNFSASPFNFDVVKTVIDGDPVEILQQPNAINIAQGGSGQINIVAGGGSSQGLNYLWHTQNGQNGTAIDPNDLSDNYSGADTATLTIQNATLTQSQSYYCLVSDRSVPSNSQVSQTAAVTVFIPIQTSSEGPVSQHADPGDLVQFQVFASGAGGNFNHQWQYKGLAGTWQNLINGGDISGAIGPILSIANVSDGDVGTYRCRLHQPGIPENITYSQEAGLSLLRFTSHPIDGWGYPGDAFTFQAGAEAGGRSLSYQWYSNGETINDATGASFSTHFEQHRRKVYYDVSDGIHTLRSDNGFLQPVKEGTLAADSFNRGFLNRKPLNANVLLPFGSRIWSATPNLVYHQGQAINDQSLAVDDIASIPFEPRDLHRMGLKVSFRFGNNPPANSWFAFGFTTNGTDFQSDGEIWVKLKPAFNNQITYEVFANGTSHLISSQTIDGAKASWSLEYNPDTRNVTLFNGGKPLVNAATANIASNFEVNKAQFMFHSGGANNNGGEDFQLSLFRLYETAILIGRPDFFAVDINQASSVNLDVLQNDQGDGLDITDVVIQDLMEFGLARRFEEDGKPVILYDVLNPNEIGQDRFKYKLSSAVPNESYYVEATVLRYKDFAMVAKDDEVTVTADQANDFNPIINDFHSQTGAMHLDPSVPFPTLPAHGSVVIADTQRIRYTPHPGYVGTDTFTYQIEDEQGRKAQGTIKVFVTEPFEGLFYDNFSNTGAGRGIGASLDQAKGESGNFAWSDLDTSFNAPYQFGNGEANHTFTNLTSNFVGIRFQENLNSIVGTTLQTDDFESGIKSSWAPWDPANKFSVTTTNPISGSKSLLVNFDGARLDTRILVKYLHQDHDHFRVKFKFETQSLNMAINESFAPMVFSGAEGSNLVLYIKESSAGRTAFFYVYDLDRKAHRSASFPIGNGVHDIELKWASGATGEASMRIDNHQPITVTGFANHKQSITRVSLGAYGADAGTTGTLRYDDVEMQGKGDLLAQTTIAFPEEAGTDAGATFAWVQFPKGLDRLREGLHVEVGADGQYKVIQYVIQELDEALGSGQIPLAPGQPIRIELWYHGLEKSISVWLNGYRVIDRALLNQRGFIEDWRTLGFVAEGPTGLASPFRILDFSLDGNAQMSDDVLPDLVVHDSFTGIDGTQIASRPTDIGNLNWLTNSRTILLDNRLSLTGTGGKAFGLPFDPDHYQGDQIEISAAIAPGGANWAAFGFANGAEPAYWSTGQVWVNLRSDGQYNFYANSTQNSLSQGLQFIPGFKTNGLNHVRLRYNTTSRLTQLWINGVYLHEVDLDTLGFIPNISYVGLHVHAVNEAAPTFIDDVTIRLNDGNLTQTGQQISLIADTFETGGSASIHNRPPLIGGISWQATSEMHYNNFAAGIKTVDQVGVLPFLPANYEGETLLVEVDAKVGNGESIGVGYNNAVSDFTSNGQLWAEVTNTGQWRLRANGATVLASGSIAGFNLNHWTRTQLWYHRNSNTADLWVNGVVVAQNKAMPAGFTPNIRYAGLDLNAKPGINATTLQADNFRLALDDITPSALFQLQPEIVDTFSSTSLLNGKQTELGGKTWIANAKLQADSSGRVVQIDLNHPGGISSGYVPFDPSAYTKHLFSIEAELSLDTAYWMGVGFSASSGDLKGHGQVWAKLEKTGYVRLLGLGNNQIYAGQSKIFFANAYNKVTVVYDRLNNTASLLINDYLQAKNIPLVGTPNIKRGSLYWNVPQVPSFQFPGHNLADNFAIKTQP